MCNLSLLLPFFYVALGKIAHPGRNLLKMALSFLSSIILPFLFIGFGYGIQAQNCTSDTPTVEINLTASPDASWSTSEGILLNGQCCDAPNTSQCTEIVLTLHPDANGVSFVFTTPVTGLMYQVDCGPVQIVANEQAIHLCFDQEATEPHIITFCHHEDISPEFTVFSVSNPLQVSLSPFEPVCEGSAGFMLSGGSPSGGIYFINGNPMPFFNVIQLGPGDHEITYQYIDPISGCMAFASQILTVVATPQITWTQQQFCTEDGLQPLTGASPEGGNYSGSFITNNHFDVDAAVPGTYSISYHYMDTYGCSNTYDGNVTIHPLPHADAGPNQQVASGTMVNLSAADPGAGDFAYAWEPALSLVNPNLQHVQSMPLFLSTHFSLQVTNTQTGCKAADDVMVQITGGPLHVVDISAESVDICIGNGTTLEVFVGGGSGNYHYEWTAIPADAPAFPSNLVAPIASPLTTTTYTVVVSDANDATLNPVSASIEIVVNPLPDVQLNLPPTVCANTPGYSLTGGYPAGGYYQMLDEHDELLHLPYIDFANFLPEDIGPGSYQVIYHYTDPATQCYNYDIKPFTILPWVKAQFYTNRDDICLSETINIANHSEGATDYFWDFGDGTTGNQDEPSFVHTFPQLDHIADYTITLTATNAEGCTDHRQRHVKVFPPVHAEFTADPVSGCSELEVQFRTRSEGPILYHFWDFGDGTFSVEEDPLKSYVNLSNSDTVFTVTLTVLSVNYFCSSTYTMEITVHPYIEAGFTMNPVSGCHPLEVAFGNLAIGATEYAWDFGNGQTSADENPGTLTFNNTTESIIEYTITQMVNNGNCFDSATATLEVWPGIEADFSASETEGCSPLEIDFTNLSTPSATHYEWDFGDGASSSGQHPHHTFINADNDPITRTVWLRTRTDHFCRDSISMEITVFPELKADFVFQPAQSCNPFDLEIFNNSSGVTDYLWDMGDGTTYTHETDTLVHSFEHDDPDPVTYPIQLLVSNNFGCADSLERPFTLFPKIESAFTPSIDWGCNPLEVTFTNESTGASEHLWEFGDGGSSVQLSPVHIFENTSYTNDTVFDVWLYSRSPYLCTDSTLHQITVAPKVKADFTIENNQGCSPFIVTIANHSRGAAALDWDFGNGQISDEMDDQLIVLYENTTGEIMEFDVLLTAVSPSGCIDTLRRKVTVFPEVIPQYTHETQGCHPLEITFTNTTQNAHSYSWDFGDGILGDDFSPQHIFLNFDHVIPVTYPVEYFAQSVYGCFATGSSQVEVFPKPDASFLITNSPACSPHDLLILNNSEGVTDFQWDFADGSGIWDHSADTILHHFNHPHGTGPGLFPITLTTQNSFGCLDTLVQQAIIYPTITAAVEANILEGCHPLTIDFTNLSEGATAEGAYSWSYGNGHSSQTLSAVHSHTFHNFSHTKDTVYTVTLIAYNENQCTDTTQLDIRVFPKPKAFFSVPNASGCGPHEAIVQDFSQGVSEYTWNMGDGEVFHYDTLAFTHVYNQSPGSPPAQFTITLNTINSHECTDSHLQQILVYPEVTAVFSTQNEGCHPHNAVFTNQSEGGELFLWNFGNGNTSQAAHTQQTFINYGHTESNHYTVNLMVESTYGCTAETTQQIAVRPIPKPQFQLSPSTGCSPFSPHITNSSIGATTFAWDFGNGTAEESSQSFTHTWTNTSTQPEQYPVTLTVWSEYGCEAAIQQVTTVYPQVTAAFESEDDIWQGCSPLTLRFLNQSELADSYQWDFDDGEYSTSASPLHVFENDEIEDVVLGVQLVATSIFGCRDTLVRDVTVFPMPNAYFTATPRTQAYPNATITLSNLTNPGYWEFEWEFGDGNHTQTNAWNPFTHTFIWDEYDWSTRDYTVSLLAFSEHCENRHLETVTITSPVPKADVTSITAGCEPFTVQFSNESMYAHSFRWYFNDGAVSNDPAPEHTFMDPGDYEVMMIAIGDGGRDTTYHHVEVLPNPIANFELLTPHVNIPEEPLLVKNTSQGADMYLWDFGDGNISFEFEPEHYYTEPGIYSITLVATSNTMPLCHDTIILKNAPRVDEACRIIFPDAFMPDLTGPGDGYYDPIHPSTQVFHPVHMGVDDYTLEIFNRWGELIFRSNDILKGWDGYYRGKLSKMDVYVWKVTGKCTSGRSFIQTGDVTLYR